MLISLTLITLNIRAGGSFSFVSVKGDVREVVSPLRNTLNGVVNPFSSFLTGAIDYGSLRKKEGQLEREVQTLKGGYYSYQSMKHQLSVISSLDHLPFWGSLSGVAAQVINFTPSNVQLSFEVNRGSAAGVRLGDPVVSGAGLAGRVVAVASNTSTVLMTIDPSFSAGVRLPSSGVAALAQGQGPGLPLKLLYVTPGTVFKKNEVLSTSGLQGEVFPSGIPVGRVTKAYIAPGSLQESVDLVPVVNYSSLEYVKILFWSPPG